MGSNIRIENLTDKKRETPGLKCYSKCQCLDLSLLVGHATRDYPIGYTTFMTYNK